MLRRWTVIFLFWPLCLFAGCNTPNQENIRLRKLNQDLTAQVESLKTQKEADERVIAAQQKREPTIPTLPPAELKKFWLTTGLKFGKFTGGMDGGMHVYVCPTDENDAPIQTAGSIVVEAFDLAEPGDNRVGRWTWDAVAARACWRSFLLEFDYELNCPWQKVPRHPDVTVRVTFTDELTHLSFVAEKLVHVELPPSGHAIAPHNCPSTVI